MRDKMVLIIDDDEAVCNLIKALLEGEGFRVFSVSNGEEGLAMIGKTIPDLIILDMNMPKMSGVDFYSKIAKPEDGSPMIPVIVLTGRGNMKSMFENLGVSGFLAKPFHASELIATVKKAING